MTGGLYGGSGGSYRPPGQMAVAPVISQPMVQQQVNSARAHNDATAAGQIRRTNQQVAGQGYGSRSPLAMALQGQVQSANAATNADTARQTRLDAATLNASDSQARQIAQMQQQASMYGSDQSRAASQYGADSPRTACMYGSDQALQAALSSAAANRYGSDQARASSQYGADQSLKAAGVGANASMYGADRGAQSSMYGSDRALQGQLGAANVGANASMYNAGLGLQGQLGAANIGANASNLNALLGLEGTKYSSMNSLLAAILGGALSG